MVAIVLLFTSVAHAATPMPAGNEYETRAARMFAAGHAPKGEEFEHHWFCVQPTKSGYVAENEPGVLYKDGRLHPDDFSAGIRTEKQETALILEYRDFKRTIRTLETPKGLRLVIEKSRAYPKTKTVSKITGQSVADYALCVQRKDIFGEAADPNFMKYAKDTFEVGRLPTNLDFKGDWTCAYQEKAKPIAFFTPPKILVKNGTIFMPEFNGKKSVRMTINDKAWVATLEDGDVRSAYRWQRSPEGNRLLQEATGVGVDGRPPMGLTKPATTTAICLPTEEITERFFGAGTLGEAAPAQTNGSAAPKVR